MTTDLDTIPARFLNYDPTHDDRPPSRLARLVRAVLQAISA